MADITQRLFIRLLLRHCWYNLQYFLTGYPEKLLISNNVQNMKQCTAGVHSGLLHSWTAGWHRPPHTCPPHGPFTLPSPDLSASTHKQHHAYRVALDIFHTTCTVICFLYSLITKLDSEVTSKWLHGGLYNPEWVSEDDAKAYEGCGASRNEVPLGGSELPQLPQKIIYHCWCSCTNCTKHKCYS